MTFDEYLAQSGPRPIVALFYGAGCPPCEVLKPNLRNVCRTSRVQLEEFNSANELPALKALEIRSVPTVVVIVKGEARVAFRGALDAETIRYKLGEHGIADPGNIETVV